MWPVSTVQVPQMRKTNIKNRAGWTQVAVTSHIFLAYIAQMLRASFALDKPRVWQLVIRKLIRISRYRTMSTGNVSKVCFLSLCSGFLGILCWGSHGWCLLEIYTCVCFFSDAVPVLRISGCFCMLPDARRGGLNLCIFFNVSIGNPGDFTSIINHDSCPALPGQHLSRKHPLSLQGETWTPLFPSNIYSMYLWALSACESNKNARLGVRSRGKRFTSRPDAWANIVKRKNADKRFCGRVTGWAMDNHFSDCAEAIIASCPAAFLIRSLCNRFKYRRCRGFPK